MRSYRRCDLSSADIYGDRVTGCRVIPEDALGDSGLDSGLDESLEGDMMQDESSFDIMMFGSGAIRKKELGPLVEYQDMVENTPFDDVVWMFEVVLFSCFFPPS